MGQNENGNAGLTGQVLDLIKEHLEQVVELDTPLRDVCDELDMIELFMAVEEEFEVSISLIDEAQIETPQDFVDFIENYSEPEE